METSRGAIGVLAGTTIFLLVFVASPVRGLAAGVGGAEAYYQWLVQCIGAIEEDVPAITRAAEAAAKVYVKHDGRVGVLGDPSLFQEAFARSGGMMKLFPADAISDGKPHDIVLMPLREDTLSVTLAKAQEFRKAGKMVIAIGRSELLGRAVAQGVKFDASITNHAAAKGGLFPQGQEQVVPTDSAANIVCLWAWTGEFVAACTRLGKMPPMIQGAGVPEADQRNRRIGIALRNAKFHDVSPPAVDAGRIAQQYLDRLRQTLRIIHNTEMQDVARAGRLASKAISDGGKLYAFLHSQSVISAELDRPGDPGYFTQLNRDWFHQRTDVKLGGSDLVLCMGYDGPFDARPFGDWTARARKSGATLVWSFAGFRPAAVNLVKGDEVFINQHWVLGDAVVSVPGYDIKILPTSGVIATALLWMVHAELLAPSDPDDLAYKGGSSADTAAPIAAAGADAQDPAAPGSGAAPGGGWLGGFSPGPWVLIGLFALLTVALTVLYRRSLRAA